MGKSNATLVSPVNGSVPAENLSDTDEAKESFHQALLACSLSASNLSELVNNREQIQHFYQGELSVNC